MTKKQSHPLIVHGIHAKRRSKTKCGMSAWRLPDGNHRVVQTNAVGQITCKKCLANNKPGVC